MPRRASASAEQQPRTRIYVRPQMPEEAYKKLVQLKEKLEVETWDELAEALLQIVDDYLEMRKRYEQMVSKYEELKRENKKLWKVVKRCMALAGAV